jgi:hypothetical protein
MEKVIKYLKDELGDTYGVDLVYNAICSQDLTKAEQMRFAKMFVGEIRKYQTVTYRKFLDKGYDVYIEHNQLKFGSL